MARSRAVAWCTASRYCSGTESLGPVRLRPRPDTVERVDVRIGVQQAPREINLEVDDEGRDELTGRVEAALSGAADVLSVTDKRGRDVILPAAKIAYVEIGSPDGDRRIGFGG